MEQLQDFILSQAIILLALLALLVAIAYRAITGLKQYRGFGLGVALGLLFIVVRVSIAEMVTPANVEIEEYLNGFQVFTAIAFGMAAGLIVLAARHFGRNNRRVVGLQIAAYTAILIILIFLVAISNPVIQKMIGLFTLAVGVTALFALVLLPEEEEQLNIGQPGATGGTAPVHFQNPRDAGSGGGMKSSNPADNAKSTLNQIRERQKDKFPRRR